MANMENVRKAIKTQNEKQKNKLISILQRKNYHEGLKVIEQEIDLSKKMGGLNYEISCFKEDGVYQLNKAIEEIYGVSIAASQSNPSGEEMALETISVTLADGTTQKIPYGQINLPDLGEEAYIDIQYNQGKQKLYIRGEVQFRFSDMIDQIVARTRELLNTESVYKDQAIEIDSNMVPKILDLSNIDKEFMVLNSITEYQLIPLYSRIRQPEKCRQNNISLKTGILFEGRYGTGKTLLAFKIAQEAIKNNWSFIYLKDPRLLAQVLKMSKTLDNNGNGIIVFLEDVDQIVSGERDEVMQDILNTIDGGDTKQMNVISIFTTNHIERINPTFLRGKRIGSIVSMGSLDSKAIREFLEHSFDNYDINLDEFDSVIEEIRKNEIVPAFMAEIVEKTKANLIFEDSNEVKPEYLSASLVSYLKQVNLAKTEVTADTPERRLVKAVKDIFNGTVDKEMAENVEEVKELIENI